VSVEDRLDPEQRTRLKEFAATIADIPTPTRSAHRISLLKRIARHIEALEYDSPFIGSVVQSRAITGGKGFTVLDWILTFDPLLVREVELCEALEKLDAGYIRKSMRPPNPDDIERFDGFISGRDVGDYADAVQNAIIELIDEADEHRVRAGWPIEVSLPAGLWSVHRMVEECRQGGRVNNDLLIEYLLEIGLGVGLRERISNPPSELDTPSLHWLVSHGHVTRLPNGTWIFSEAVQRRTEQLERELSSSPPARSALTEAEIRDSIRRFLPTIFEIDALTILELQNELAAKGVTVGSNYRVRMTASVRDTRPPEWRIVAENQRANEELRESFLRGKVSAAADPGQDVYGRDDRLVYNDSPYEDEAGEAGGMSRLDAGVDFSRGSASRPYGQTDEEIEDLDRLNRHRELDSVELVAILDDIAQKANITISDIRGTSRAARVVQARKDTIVAVGPRAPAKRVADAIGRSRQYVERVRREEGITPNES
jgi:hypothetical protein